MALQDANIFFPKTPQGMDYLGGGGYDSTLMDAVNEKIAYCIIAPKDGTIDSIGFLTGTVTTGDDLKVSFQDRTTTDAFPDGTIDEYRVITIADGDDTVWKTTGIISSDGTDLGTKRTVSKGDIFFIVFEFDSYVAGNLNLKNTGSVFNHFSGNSTYLATHNGTSWSASVIIVPTFALKYDDGTYAWIPEVVPASAISTSSIDTGTTPDEIALKFQVPYSCKVTGAWFSADVDGDVDIILYDSDGSTIMDSGNATVSIDKDNRSATTRMLYSVLFSGDPTISINTNYYLAFKPTSLTNAILAYMDVDSAVIFDQLDGGQECHWAQQTDGGGWSATTTRRPLMGLIISALDDGVGGGGSGVSQLIYG